MNDLKTAVLLLSIRQLTGVGDKTIQQMLGKLEEVEGYSMNYLKSLEIPRLSKALESEGNWRQAVEYSKKNISKAVNNGETVLTPFSEGYPKRFLKYPEYPSLLFVKGDASVFNRDSSIAVIGTRNPTNIGEKTAERLSEELAKDGRLVVSGLALGSDTAGHRGALKGGVTAAVLSTPVSGRIYPYQNKGLSEEIVDKGGALISEYEPWYSMEGRMISNLITRDKWQAALSDGVLAAETSLRGGTNHAIRYAVKHGIPVGVFDYSQRFSEALDKEWYGGNKKWIEEGVIGVSSSDSFGKFLQSAEEYATVRGTR